MWLRVCCFKCSTFIEWLSFTQMRWIFLLDEEQKRWSGFGFLHCCRVTCCLSAHLRVLFATYRTDKIGRHWRMHHVNRHLPWKQKRSLSLFPVRLLVGARLFRLDSSIFSFRWSFKRTLKRTTTHRGCWCAHTCNTLQLCNVPYCN